MNKALQKRLYALFLLIITCSFIANRASASHAVASDLTYKCLGGNKYQITLTFYRDCAGIPAPNQADISITSASCSQSIAITLDPIAGTGQDVTPTCPTTVTTCHGGTFFGIEQWVYRGTVTLPMQCTDWTFSYSLCCRNASITTISNPNTSSIYIAATLNNVVSQCHDSPVFSNKPVPFICVGQPFCFNHGATADYGDSLAYEMITPLQSASQTVNYISPYTAAQPLNSSPAVTFDSTNGEICMTPQQLQVTVMAVLVKDYENGVLVGTVERDMQVIVMNCNNDLPWLSGINGTNVFNMNVCAGAPFCFTILSNDIDTGQTLTVNWNSGITGATFNSAGDPHPTSTFCWTPPDSDVSNTPYCFTATVKDNACPYNGSQTFSYCITVGGLKVDLGPDQQIACSDWATIYATVNSPGSFTYLWNTRATTTYITAGAGTYWCTVTNGSCSASDTVVITSPYVPVASFTNTGPSCVNSAVVFTDHSTSFQSTISNWTWNFGDGSAVSNLQNPTHIYPDSGTYLVQLLVANNLGCMDSVVDTVRILSPPITAFTWVSSCPALKVNFTDQSSGGAASWQWNFGDGQISTSQNPTHIYSSPGSYNVTLIASNGLGCPDTIVNTINVSPTPVTTFVAAPVCVGSSTAFNGSSTGAVASWHWSFGNGDTAVSQNAIYTFDSAGTYVVTLITTSGNGCNDTVANSVIIHPLPTANAGPDISICNGSSGTLTASGGVTYSWTPGGGSNNVISVNPVINTTYTVTVTDANGCAASDTVSVHVNPLPSAAAGPDTTICNGASAILTASGGVNYIWAPSGDITTTITVNPTGNATYTVTVTDINGCSAAATATVTINNPSPITLANAALCGGETTILDAGVTGVNYLWSTGATTQTIGVTSTGSYTVTTTDFYGCSTSASCTVTPGIIVTIVSGNATICQGQTTTLDAGHPGGTYIWSPNGETTQVITVGSAGNYGVTVTDASGCKGSDTVTVNVRALPNANAGPDQSVCSGVAATLTANGGSTYQWSTGSSNQSIQVSPSSNSTYYVTVTDNFGCSASDTVNVTVNANPVVSLSPALICTGFSATLDAGNPGSTYLWSPNGETTESISVSTSGNYGVTVTDASGCSSSAQTTVTAGGAVSANPVVATICQGQSTTIDAGNPGYNYIWSTGSTAEVITVSTGGTYSVTVTNPGGCSATIVNTVTANPLPTVVFTAPSTCLANPAVFTDQSSISSGSITSWNWSFGDGQTSSQQNPAYYYSNAGTYSVTLQVTSNNGCTASSSQSLTINPLPSAGFSTNAACSQDTAVFLDQSTVPGGSIVNWNWNFGDGTSGREKNETHAYSTANQYDVSLTVTTDNGCQDSINYPIDIYDLPSETITAPSVCQGTPVLFSNSGSTAGPPITSSFWSFGDGATSDSLSATHTYSTSGSYNVSLRTSNRFGCTSTATTQVDIYAQPNPVFSAANACMGVEISFTNSSSINSGDSLIYSWNFGNNLGASAQADPKYNYPFEGTFTVTLNVTSSHGCASSTTEPITVYPLPVVIIEGLASGCSPLNAALIDSSKINSGTIVGWLWDFGDGDVSTQEDPSHIYTTPGNYQITLTVSSDKGCTASATGTEYITIYPSAKAAFTMEVTHPDIEYSIVHLNNQSNDYTSLLWDFGDGDTSTAFSPTHTYRDTGDFTIVLVANNAHNCPDTAARRMSIEPQSTLYAPNAFTPNGDGLNDVWKPVYTDMTNIQVQIFDRWGAMLTQWDGLNGYWDGIYNGHLVQQDVYVYQIQGTGADGKVYSWTGDITVVR